MPMLENLEDLADHIHLSQKLLYRLSKFNVKYYKAFDIPKKSGGVRNIACPSKEIKALQAWILRNILDNLTPSKEATGFRKRMGILTNAEKHKNNRYFICLDIENFFPSIPYAKVYQIFRTIGYNEFICHVLTSYCTYNEKVPQGGVTSPALSNLVCIHMDKRISGYVGKHNITYSRYADDMTFSSMNPSRLIGIKKFVTKIISEEGFQLNENKTRYLGPRMKRKITGIIISDDKMGVGKAKKKRLRAKIFSLLFSNLPQADREKMKNHIQGWLSFLKDVDPKALSQLNSYYSKLLLTRKGIKSNLDFPGH